MYKYVILVIAYFIPLQALATESLTALDLFDKYQATRKEFESFIAKSVTTIEENDTEEGLLLKREASEIRFDGIRVDYSGYQWHINSKDKPIPVEDADTRSFIWDNRSFFEYRKGKNSNGTAFIRGNDKIKKGQISILYAGAPLIGVLNGDFESVDLILNEADTLSVRDELELVGESHCYVIDATTPYGEYTVWIDPKHGYNISKAEVRKKENDLAWGKPLNWIDKNLPKINYIGTLPKMESFSFSLKNVRFEKVNDIWIPIEADYEDTKTYTNGRTITTKKHHERTHIDIEPDFAAIGAFVPNIPDGTRVLIENSPGIEYEWIGGKPVANIDKFFFDALEKTTDELISNTKLLPMGTTEEKIETSPNKPTNIANITKVHHDESSTATDVNTDITENQQEKLLGSIFFSIPVLILICLLVIVAGWFVVDHFKRKGYVNN